MALKICKEEGRRPRFNGAAKKLNLDIPTSENVRVATSSIKQGVSITKGEWQERPLADRDKGLNWYDFTIDSLQASGLISEMKFSQLNEGSIASADALADIPLENNDVNA